ncbi:MAG TPA: VCBS domain-containing protein, partial [Pseudolabrys sp.]|nr:VCBS domain-containing protein [Pseudolabrys sp.]
MLDVQATGFDAKPAAAGSALVVGQIEAVVGACSLTRPGGDPFRVKPGDPICRGDLLETTAGGKVGIRFIDGTAFNLSDSARAVVKEFGCDGTEPSALLDISRGTFAFIAGEMAKHGGLRIETPFARIRGRAQSGGIGMLSLASLFFAALDNAQGATTPPGLEDGIINIRDSNDIINAPFGIIELTVGSQTIFIDTPFAEFVVRGTSVSQVPLSLAQLQQHIIESINVQSIAALGQGPTVGGPSGSGGLPPLGPPPFVPINFELPPAPPTGGPTGGSNGSPSSPDIFIPPPPPPPPPATNSARVSEEGLTGSNPDTSPSVLDTTNLNSANGTLSDVNLGGSQTVTLGDPGTGLTSGGQPVTWTGVGSHTLEGKVGDATIITVTITDEGNFTVTLGGQVDHPNAAFEDLKIITVPIFVSNGQETTLQVIIEDDAPKILTTNATVFTDDETATNPDASPNLGGTGDYDGATPPANLTGTLSHSYGADGTGTTLLLGTGAPSGFTYTLSNGGQTLTISQIQDGVSVNVLLVQLSDTTNGGYTVTQLNEIDHPTPGESEENIQFTVNYRVTDHDGDTVDGTLTIDADDDTPLVRADTDSVTVGAGNIADGNVVTGSGGSDANSTDGVADSAGADGFGGVVGVAAGNTGADLVNGTTVGVQVTGAYGKLTLNADGSYSYDPNDNIASVTNVQDIFTY